MALSGALLAQRWDYYQKYLEEKAKAEKNKESLETQLRDLKGQEDNYKKYVDEYREKSDKFEQDYNDAETQRKKLERKNQTYEASLKDISASLSQIKTSLTLKDEEIKNLKNQIDKYKDLTEEAIRKKEEAIDGQQKLNLELGNLQGEINDKENQLQRIMKELWESKQIISAVRSAGVNIPALMTRARPLDGQIVAISDDNNIPIVMVSIGKDDGVEKGYQFTVYRGSEYIGRVVVEEVYKDMSAARILSNITPGTIRKGDNVTTRIGGGGSY